MKLVAIFYLRATLLVLFIITQAHSFAQSRLEVFTNSQYEHFWLYVNGKKINENAEGRIEVRAIEGGSITVKVVFEDKNLPDIIDKFTTGKGETEFEGQRIIKGIDLTLEIQKSKKGNYKLKTINRNEIF